MPSGPQQNPEPDQSLAPRAGNEATECPARLVRAASPAGSDPAGAAPFLSLVLATCGRAESLGILLESLRTQAERSFELIVVDQNPDDRICPHLSRAREAGISVRRLRQDVANLSLARNAGLAAARGEFVAFPDDDCWYEDDTIAQVRAGLDSAPGCDGAIARWVEVSPQASLPGRLNLDECRRFRGGDASSITLFLRLATVRSVGGFDTRFGIGRWYGAGEETDLVLRLLAAGADLHTLPAARVRHAPPQGNGTVSLARWQARRRRERAVGALYAKHRLPLRVVVRGLLAPPATGMFSSAPGSRLGHFALGLAATLGRLEGLAHWILRGGRQRT